ncbi:hypothetical protein SAMN05216388_102533 [Halorientalis persicus]|uniref:Uncharacterized protein n=1 Tax=Halorientalis persicus TaxID=1367881 RepID=A0A1H8U2T1_9EURY|nr:hypothetical protein [Halorientalis persicus]SEO97471.1 hypothetical protein SAMN05216388_102533 [Halorientalis persicus]
MGSKEERYKVDGVDDGLDEKEDADGQESESRTTPSTSSQRAENGESSAGTADKQASDSGTGNEQEIPHRVRYDSPQENRSALTIYVGDEDERRIRELVQLAEDEFDEKVYETDVQLAALRCDLDDDDSFLTEMRAIGYGYFE